MRRVPDLPMELISPWVLGLISAVAVSVIGALSWRFLIRPWPDLTSEKPQSLEEEFWWAEQRADQLLRSVLTAREYKELTCLGYLRVPSPSCSGRTYWVPFQPGNVLVLEDGRPTRRLCVKAEGFLPRADVFLMHN
jgi:hypothetical protein